MSFAHPDEVEVLARAVSAGVGIAVGRIALDSETAARWAAEGEDVVLVRSEAVTSDIAGIVACRGILTAVGGRTSHAAVVARQLGKVCLVGCSDLAIDMAARRCRIGRALSPRATGCASTATRGACWRVAPTSSRVGRPSGCSGWKAGRSARAIRFLPRPTNSRKRSSGSLDGGCYRTARGKCRYRSGRADGTDIIRRNRDLHLGRGDG